MDKMVITRHLLWFRTQLGKILMKHVHVHMFPNHLNCHTIGLVTANNLHYAGVEKMLSFNLCVARLFSRQHKHAHSPHRSHFKLYHSNYIAYETQLILHTSRCNALQCSLQSCPNRNAWNRAFSNRTLRSDQMIWLLFFDR